MNSYWIDSTKNFSHFDTLKENIHTDVTIIGAGITGISTAYELCKHGVDVVVVDRNDICSHTTANTTAKITSGHDLFYNYLIHSFSKEFAKQYLYANEEAILNIKNIVQKENINCDFEVTDNYIFTQNKNDVKKITDEVDAINFLGINAAFVTTSPLPLKILGAIKLTNQAQFHPRKYVFGLCNSLLENNVRIYANTTVYDVKNDHDEYITYTKNNKITSKYVVIASHYPIINAPGFYFLKMYQEKSYLIAIETNDQLFDGMYINSEQPTLSFRTAKYKDKRLLLVGGSGHKAGQNDHITDSYTFLERTAKLMYPDSTVLYKWSTQDCISLDKIPYIGEFSRMAPHIYVATGFKKWGMTTSNIASNIIADKILGKKNEYENIFESTRFHPIKNHEEVSAMIKQTGKSLVVDKFIIPKETIETLKDEDGKILEIDGKKVGVYKSNDKIYKINPICSHLGCELVFNPLEKTWDCPCHGSRFDYTGKSIFEPSIKDLE